MRLGVARRVCHPITLSRLARAVTGRGGAACEQRFGDTHMMN